MNAFAVSRALLHGLAATRHLADPRERHTPAHLLARVDELHASGYTVVTDDADIWVHCIGPLEWLLQLESRIANAEFAKYRTEMRNRCVTCGGSGSYWDQDLDGEHMRLACTDCAAADRRVA